MTFDLKEYQANFSLKYLLNMICLLAANASSSMTILELLFDSVRFSLNQKILCDLLGRPNVCFGTVREIISNSLVTFGL